jgi:hypothetical protein
MKKQNSFIMFTIITAALCILSGAWFLSCPLPAQGDYGTLVVVFPGRTAQAGAAAARAAVSDAFSATLTYRVDCDGPGGSITRHGRADASLSIPLNAGDWTITATVFNAAGQSIGSGAARALIESGSTTALQLPVAIDTGGNGITGFALTSPVSATGSIASNSTAIAVPVPFGTDLTGIGFTLTHTGVSVSPSPGTMLDFSSPQTFTVTAENGQTKTWTVTITPALSPPSGGVAAWPSASTWQNYGLSNITQPEGTTVYTAGVSSGVLVVYLQNAGIAAFNNLIAQIETLAGSASTTSSASGYSNYELAYNFSGALFALSLVHTNGIAILSIEPDDPGAFFTWPDDSRWAAFNLSGLIQPAGTAIGDVTETNSPSAMLSVTLNSINNTVYESLLNRITALLGNPYTSTGSAVTPTREAVFMTILGANSVTVILEMDVAYDEIIVAAIKY